MGLASPSVLLPSANLCGLGEGGAAESQGQGLFLPSQAGHPPCTVLEYRQGSLTSITHALLQDCFTEARIHCTLSWAVLVEAPCSQLAIALVLVPGLHCQYSKLFTVLPTPLPAWLLLPLILPSWSSWG